MSEETIKVKVVDDTSTNVKIINKFIEVKDYEVSVADKDQEAVEMYPINRPEIALIDGMKPLLDGH